MKKGYWGLVIIGLVLIAGWFYWFQYRPAKFRSGCHWEAYWASVYYSDGRATTDAPPADFVAYTNETRYAKAYYICLNKRGLK